MTKQEYLEKLKAELRGLPKDEISERVVFYSETIDDRIEEGLAEEEAVAAVGPIDEIAAQIRSELSQTRALKKENNGGRRMKAWEIVLLAVGSPIWLALLIAAVAIMLSVYAVLWSAIVTLWAVFAALIGSAIGCLAGGVIVIVFGNAFIGVLLLGGALACAGLSIFMFFGCRESTKAIAWLTKWIFVSLKNCIVRREKNDENGN